MGCPDEDAGLAKDKLRVRSTAMSGNGPLQTCDRADTKSDPVPLDLPAQAFGSFGASKLLSADGDIIAVATPGHTADHVSIIVQVADVQRTSSGRRHLTQSRSSSVLARQLSKPSSKDVSTASIGFAPTFSGSS
jgi:hypothetical protein